MADCQFPAHLFDFFFADGTGLWMFGRKFQKPVPIGDRPGQEAAGADRVVRVEIFDETIGKHVLVKLVDLTEALER